MLDNKQEKYDIAVAEEIMKFALSKGSIDSAVTHTGAAFVGLCRSRQEALAIVEWMYNVADQIDNLKGEKDVTIH